MKRLWYKWYFNNYTSIAMNRLKFYSKDTVALLSRRAYDIAGASLGQIKVYLNGDRIPIKGFKDYVDLYLDGQTDETGAPCKVLYEPCGERWQVAIAPSNDGFQHMSFVNSIATTKGKTKNKISYNDYLHDYFTFSRDEAEGKYFHCI